MMNLQHLLLLLLLTICNSHLWGYQHSTFQCLPATKHKKTQFSTQEFCPPHYTRSSNQQQLKLYCQLHQTHIPYIRQEAHLLHIEHPNNQSIQKLVPIIFDLTTKAKQERSIVKAYSWINLAQDFVTLGKNLAKGTTAVIKGSTQGLKTALTPIHYKELVVGLMHAIQAGFTAMTDAEMIEEITNCSDAQIQQTLLKNHNKKITQEQIECAKQWKLICNYVTTTPWDELIQSGAEMGTLLLIDTIVLNAAAWTTSKKGQELISKLAQCSASDALKTELTYETAALSRVLIEEGLPKKTLAAADQAAIIKTIDETKTFEEMLLKATQEKSPKQRIVILKPLQRTPTEAEIDTILTKYQKHIFTDDHKKLGIYKFGSTGDKNSEIEILQNIKKIVQRLIDEKKFVLGSNQIHTTMNGHPLELKVYFDNNGILESINTYFGHSNRMMDYKLVFKDEIFKPVLRRDTNVIAVRKDD